MNIDENIVSGIVRRDNKAFELFCDTYGAFIKAVCRYHLAGWEDAQEECVNDILLSVWNNAEKFDPEKNSLKNWVAAICKYRCIDYKRKWISLARTEDIDKADIPVYDAYNSINDDIESLLSALPEKDRDLFYRHYILGQSVKEIAANDVSVAGGLYNRLSRGRKKLKSIMKRSCENEK